MTNRYRDSAMCMMSRFTVCARALAILAISTALSGCPLVEELEDIGVIEEDDPGHCELGRKTPDYFSQAIHFDAASQEWVFHSWKGSRSDGGCEIRINVRDGQILTDSAVTPAFIRSTIANGLESWRQVIEGAGITCNTQTRYQSLGDSMFSSSPRIEIEFPRALDGNGIGGRAKLVHSSVGRTFSEVSVQVAARLVFGNDTVPMTTSDYQRIIAHELGHALGILGLDGATGHSLNDEDVMYTSNVCALPSQGDIETMRDVYSRTAYYRPTTPTGVAASASIDMTHVVCEYQRAHDDTEE